MRSHIAGGVGVCESVAPPAFGCRLGWVNDKFRSGYGTNLFLFLDSTGGLRARLSGGLKKKAEPHFHSDDSTWKLTYRAFCVRSGGAISSSAISQKFILRWRISKQQAKSKPPLKCILKRPLNSPPRRQTRPNQLLSLSDHRQLQKPREVPPLAIAQTQPNAAITRGLVVPEGPLLR